MGADSTVAPSLRQGSDLPAAAQRRQSFPTLLPPLTSVIKGRGKSRGEGCALIAFHGREEKAAARPEGPRRRSALCCLLERETFEGRYTFVVSRYRRMHVLMQTRSSVFRCTRTRTHARTVAEQQNTSVL